MQALQRAHLAAMVDHARRRVPLYRELYEDIPPTPALEQLPQIDRETLHARPPEERRAAPPPPLTRPVSSSGTSGHPLTVDYSPRAAWWQGVLAMRTATAHRLSPTWRSVALAHQDPRDPGSGVWGNLRRRHVVLPMTESPEALAAVVERIRPAVIGGHGHLLVELGEELGGRVRPRAVMTGGEQLTFENRAALRRVYEREPIDTYGSTEHGKIAWQCPARDLYHVNHEAVIVEVLDDAGAPVGAGELGELVITSLWNPLMPLLRHRTGDAGAIAPRPCRCGWRLPGLELVQGRMMDWIRDASGRRIAPQRLWLSVRVEGGLDLVHRYQVRQSSSGEVTVTLQPRGELGGDLLRRVEASYRRALGEGTPVEVRLASRLDGDPSGKFRTIAAAGPPPSAT